jgi:hypothetical protein
MLDRVYGVVITDARSHDTWNTGSASRNLQPVAEQIAGIDVLYHTVSQWAGAKALLAACARAMHGTRRDVDAASSSMRLGPGTMWSRAPQCKQTHNVHCPGTWDATSTRSVDAMNAVIVVGYLTHFPVHGLKACSVCD